MTLALRTTDYREARYLATLLDRTDERVLRANPYARMADLKAILKEQLAATLQADKEQYISAGPGQSVYGITPDDDNTDPLTDDLELIDLMIGDAAERLAFREVSHVSKSVAELAERYGIPAEQHTELALGLLQVELQAMQEGRARLLRGPFAPISLQDVPSNTANAPAQEPVGPLLSQLLPQFIEFMTNDGGWRGCQAFVFVYR